MVSVRFSFPTATAISPFCLFCAVSCRTIQVVPKGLQWGTWKHAGILCLFFCLLVIQGLKNLTSAYTEGMEFVQFCCSYCSIFFFFEKLRESNLHIHPWISPFHFLRYWQQKWKTMWWWTPPSRTTDWRTQLLDRKTSVKKRSFRELKLYGIFHSHIVVTFPWLPGHRKWAEPGCGNGDNGKFEETLALKIAFIILSDI